MGTQNRIFPPSIKATNQIRRSLTTVRSAVSNFSEVSIWINLLRPHWKPNHINESIWLSLDDVRNPFFKRINNQWDETYIVLQLTVRFKKNFRYFIELNWTFLILSSVQRWNSRTFWAYIILHVIFVTMLQINVVIPSLLKHCFHTMKQTELCIFIKSRWDVQKLTWISILQETKKPKDKLILVATQTWEKKSHLFSTLLVNL